MSERGLMCLIGVAKASVSVNWMSTKNSEIMMMTAIGVSNWLRMTPTSARSVLKIGFCGEQCDNGSNKCSRDGGGQEFGCCPADKLLAAVTECFEDAMHVAFPCECGAYRHHQCKRREQQGYGGDADADRRHERSVHLLGDGAHGLRVGDGGDVRGMGCAECVHDAVRVVLVAVDVQRMGLVGEGWGEPRITCVGQFACRSAVVDALDVSDDGVCASGVVKSRVDVRADGVCVGEGGSYGDFLRRARVAPLIVDVVDGCREVVADEGGCRRSVEIDARGGVFDDGVYSRRVRRGVGHLLRVPCCWGEGDLRCFGGECVVEVVRLRRRVVEQRGAEGEQERCAGGDDGDERVACRGAASLLERDGDGRIARHARQRPYNVLRAARCVATYRFDWLNRTDATHAEGGEQQCDTGEAEQRDDPRSRRDGGMEAESGLQGDQRAKHRCEDGTQCGAQQRGAQAGDQVRGNDGMFDHRAGVAERFEDAHGRELLVNGVGDVERA